MAKKMGRPKQELNMNQLAVFMRWNPSRSDTAAFFECSDDVLEKRIKEETGLTFSAFRDKNMVHTRKSLIQMAIAKAEKSDTMHIFCLKNLCNWGDKNSQTPIDEAEDIEEAEKALDDAE